MGSERANHPLDTGALLSEAWLRLQGYENLASCSEGDVVGAATNAMRRVLVDHARGRTAEKRGGPNAARLKQTLRTEDLALSLPDDALLDLEAALTDLGSLDQDLLRVVELRYFAGLSVERVAELLGRSPRSIKRDWAWARAWLFRRLTDART
jgi:RNA polymerase sigma factor (TIGR02999 family)